MDTSELNPGQKIGGKYLLEARLGEGGMGIVMRGRHLLLNEPVAIKFLSRELRHREELKQRFLREAQAAVRIKSEHVARVMDVGTSEQGTPYLVMELLVGNDLEQELERHGPLPVGVACRYVFQACDAIAEAHGLGIIHRDLKPANLFLTRRPNGAPSVKVLDFGISKMSEPGGSATQTSAIMGSPAYMSPEQLRSTKEVDGRADVWSLGVVLYELLSGMLPFPGESLADISANILRNEAPQVRDTRPDVPEALSELCRRCLQKDLSLRVASVHELARDLSSFCEPETKRVIELGETALSLPGSELPRLAAPTQASARQTKATDATAVVDSSPQATPRTRAPWPLLVVPLLALLGAAFWLIRKPAPPAVVGSAAAVASSAQQSAVPPQGPLVTAALATPTAAVAAPSASVEGRSEASPNAAPLVVARPATGLAKPGAPTAIATSLPPALPRSAPAAVPNFGGRK